MSDKVEFFGRSKIQHGTFNDRLYLMKLAKEDCPGIGENLAAMARKKGYSKIFAKVPKWAKSEFQAAGYHQEASIPRFYKGTIDACFMCRYFDPSRKIPRDPERLRQVIEAARHKRPLKSRTQLKPGFSFRIARSEDVESMAALYRLVFKTYPFPIHDPSYLAETMASHVVYFSIWKAGTLAALSSAEMDESESNVEMTDFATHPDYRGNGLAGFLLAKMDQEMTSRGIRTGYTIARAQSFGMNITAAKRGYRFSGTLINNTNIAGRLESMNVWYKPLVGESC